MNTTSTEKLETSRINCQDLIAYLKAAKEDIIIIRTTYVRGYGWHDVEFDAARAGFNTYRTFYKPYEEKHEFSECYKFVRKTAR